MYLFLLLSDWSLRRIDKRITGMTEKMYQSRDRQRKRDISGRKIQKENKQTTMHTHKIQSMNPKVIMPYIHFSHLILQLKNRNRNPNCHIT